MKTISSIVNHSAGGKEENVILCKIKRTIHYFIKMSKSTGPERSGRETFAKKATTQGLKFHHFFPLYFNCQGEFRILGHINSEF